MPYSSEGAAQEVIGYDVAAGVARYGFELGENVAIDGGFVFFDVLGNGEAPIFEVKKSCQRSFLSDGSDTVATRGWENTYTFPDGFPA